MAELQTQYPEQVDLVPVSIVGDACDLGVLGDESVDFVVANHVIEHLPDPISGLQEMARVTKPGGLLYFAVPDQRATFDRRRPVTAIAHLVDEFRNGTEQTRRAHFNEFVELVEFDAKVGPPDQDAISARVAELLETDYSIHYHVFRPEGFVDLIWAAQSEAGVTLELVAFAACDRGEDDEFIFVLGKGLSSLPRSAPQGGPRVLSEHGGFELLAEVRRRGYRRLRRALHV
jgi:SAM-dependent methyltransferase